MAYTEFMNVTFNPADYAGANTAAKEAAVIAFATKFFGFYAGGQVPDPLDPSSQNTLAHPEVVFDGADSCLKAVFAADLVEVQGAFSTKAAMDADLDAPADSLVNCWDPDPTKRGRYKKVGAPPGGSWVLDTFGDGDIADIPWPDNNHTGMLLALPPFGSWINSSPAFPLRGDAAAYPAPPGNDWTRARLTFVVRCIDFSKGPLVKGALLTQGNVAARTANLPQVHPLGNFSVPNFYRKRQLLTDVLGFNQPDSWGVPDNLRTVKDSGWVEWVVDFTPDDLDWQGMPGIDREYGVSPYVYETCPVAQLLSNNTGNIYMPFVVPTPQPVDEDWFKSAAALGIDPFERPTGTLLLKSIKAEYWTD